MSQFLQEVQRRRTFAIISHPDAGKTTLTEKLLLFSGAIHIAGSVKARKATRHATSDWMEIEKQRGISVASSVMQMLYRDCVINLLDTPGHKDFSEDTYRVLTAVDSALMVIDAANGVEPQTKRLIEVCRQRNTPIMTFINKMDREGRDPLELLDEVEQALGMPCVPMTWPVGQGKGFGGIVDLRKQHMRLFRAGEAKRADQDSEGSDEIIPLSESATLQERFGHEFDLAQGNIDLLTGAAPAFDGDAFLPRSRHRYSLAPASTTLACRKSWMRWLTWLRRRTPATAATRTAARLRCHPIPKVSPAWSSRCRPTWTPRTATVLPLCASALANTRAA